MRKKLDYKRLVVNLPVELMNNLTTKANQMGLPKSSLVIIALTQYINTDKTLKILENLPNVIEKD